MCESHLFLIFDGDDCQLSRTKTDISLGCIAETMVDTPKKVGKSQRALAILLLHNSWCIKSCVTFIKLMPTKCGLNHRATIALLVE